jgi:hypothetical protein
MISKGRSWVEAVFAFFKPSRKPRPAPRARSRPLQVEHLEEREVPAGVWTWNGPAGGGNWSNAGGGNWLLNSNAVQANQYPGVAQNDGVVFNNQNTGACTLDVPINSINNLTISGWNNTLTLNNSLIISGGNNPAFSLLDAGSRIVLANNANLQLGGGGGAAGIWNGGSIRVTAGPGGATSTLKVLGSSLTISGGASSLGANLLV